MTGEENRLPVGFRAWRTPTEPQLGDANAGAVVQDPGRKQENLLRVTMSFSHTASEVALTVCFVTSSLN